MFGSSGPGAEVLVAMERSYQESRRKERAREQALRAEGALKHTAEKAVEQEQEQMDLQLIMGLAEDDFPDDELSPFAKAGGDVGVGAETGDDSGVRAASQETDYGGSELDAEKEVLDFLEADTTWLDDDLDDCI